MTLEQAICDAVSQFNTAVFTRAQAYAFLSIISPAKSNVARLFAWLMAFDLIPPRRPAIPGAVARLHGAYFSLVEAHFPDPTAPLALLERSASAAIAADTAQRLDLFRSLAAGADLAVPPGDATAALHAHRILAILRLSNSAAYVRGFDRYVFVNYVLSLAFTTAAKLPHNVAESLTFHLTRAILPLAKIPQLLAHSPETEARNEKIDAIVTRRLPELAWELNTLGFSSRNYAVWWQILFFADDHKWPDLALIWDAIFLRKARIDSFIVELVIGHLAQVAPDREVGALERIQKFRKWRVEALVRGAVMRHKKGSGSWQRVLMALLFFVAALMLIGWVVKVYRPME
jgi:hypothetical protein